jgi:hypothetical protein
LIQGEVDLQGRADIYTNYQVKEDRGYFIIDSRPFNTFPSTGSLIWDLGISDRFPIELTVSMGAGDIVLDLSGLALTGVDISQGVGDISLILQEDGSYDIQVSQAIGSISIDLPGNTGVRIQVDRAITSLDLPSGYEHIGEDYFSPGYDSMENKINLQISQAIGNIEVRE